MNAWNGFRKLARRATVERRWSDVIGHVRAFNAYCAHHGWPDWWADMERMERNAITARVREDFDR